MDASTAMSIDVYMVVSLRDMQTLLSKAILLKKTRRRLFAQNVTDELNGLLAANVWAEICCALTVGNYIITEMKH
jgi:hypothetical protein